MASDNRPCYYPSGVIAENNVPCSSDKYTSCCGIYDLCLSNGLCYNINHHPYVLSRGACTNQNWDQGCPQYCADNNPSGGCSIINLIYRDGKATYCCGTPISDGSNVICPDNADPFTIPAGKAVTGYALLSNVSSFDAAFPSPTPSADNESPSASASTPCAPTTCATSTDASCHETAIGAGVRVPLGVIALASLAWAFAERRARRRASASSAAPLAGYTGVYAHDKKHPVSELDAHQPIPELMEGR